MQNNAVVEGYLLSPQQARIWVRQQIDGDQAYNALSALLIQGEIEVDILKSAISEIANRHEILRTNFQLLPGMIVPLQVIESDPVIAFREVDLSGCESFRKFEELFRGEALRRFDPEDSPLVRFCLARLSNSERVLVITLPALCADSRSLKILFDEIVAAYAARTEEQGRFGQPLQYVDFAEWQKQMLEMAAFEEEETDLESRRSSPDRPLMLGLECRGERSTGCDKVSMPFDAELEAKVKHLSTIHKVTPGIFLLSCWQLLIWRLAGQRDVAIDILCEGRSNEELQDAAGIFDRFCPVKLRLESDYQFAELPEMIDRAARLANDRLDHFLRQDIGAIDSGRQTDRTHAIGFEYEEWPRDKKVGSVNFSYWKQSVRIDRFKLKLGVYRTADGPTIEIHYDPAIYSQEGVELIGERYLKLIESAAFGGEALIGDLEIIGRREQERLLVEWNATGKDLPGSGCIHELIREQSQVRPESIAVTYREEQLSYRELESRANQLANYLRLLGVGPECVVGLYLDRSTQVMIGLLGILKAGGAYLPLEVGQPIERLSLILEDVGAEVIVTRLDLAEGLPTGDRGIVMLDRDRESIAGQSRAAPEVRVNSQNLAYLIYTSGSTGRPKGVMVEHGSVINLLEGLKDALYDGEDRCPTVSMNAPLAFDASVKQIIQLGRGARLSIVPEEDRIDAEAMLEHLERQGIEVLDCTHSQLRGLIEAGLGRGIGATKVVLVGGEAIDRQSWLEMSESRWVKYYNVYGPTECTVDATACEIEARNEPAIGRPISNTRIYILDPRGRTMPTGGIGDIHIGGAGVSRGYWREAGLTAEKFVPDAFGERKGERLYRTGDLGRYLHDGRLEYEGRRDAQVKVRGYRIELGEIEEALSSHPGVNMAVAAMKVDHSGQKRLVGYVIREQQRSIEGKRRRRLPNGMAVVEQNRNETDYLYEEIFRKKCYCKHKIRIPEGGCVFDVGANIGLFTLFVTQNRKGAKVYAFEPIEPIYETLRINTTLYGGDRVKTFQIGLGDKERTEWYTYYRGYSMMSGESRYAAPEEDIEVIKRYLNNEEATEDREVWLRDADEILRRRFEEERYQCRVRRLSDVIKEEGIERVDLLKVDVQRAEMDVLMGLAESDWKKIDQVVMEVHDRNGGAQEGRLEALKELLARRGYEVSIEQDELLDGTDRFNLYARRRGRVAEAEAEEEWREAAIEGEWGEVSEEELKKYAREKLPAYMVPAAIVILEKLPLTRNGKVDREGLPSPEEARKEEQLEEIQRSSPYEEIIGGIWKEVLQVERVRRGDNFFEIGGHSLLATQVISRVRKAFVVEIGVRSIFEDATVEGLARRIEEAMGAREKAEYPPLVRVSREGQKGVRLPLSFAQQRLWFLDQLDPGRAIYNVPGAVRFKGRLDLEVLEKVVNEVVRRHEVLRTRIEVDGNEPVQVIEKWEYRKLEVIDLMSLNRDEREEEVSRMAKEEAETGFDLRRGPLVRVKILKLGEVHHVLLFTMHHIISDGWSMGILSREIGALYQAYCRGEAAPLKELPIQYADFAVWQRAWLKGDRLERELAYWREHLAGAETLELPTDHPRLASRNYRGAQQRFALEPELAAALRELSRQEGGTLFMTLLAAFQTLLYRYSGQRDIVVGTPAANRDRLELEELIGFFVNTLALRLRLSSEDSFRELLHRVRKTALAAYSHDQVPFETLVMELSPKRVVGQNPIFQTWFFLENRPPNSDLVLPDITLSTVQNDFSPAKLDLTLTMSAHLDNIAGAFTYAADLFEAKTITTLTERFKSLLRAVAANPDCKLLDIPLMAPGQMKRPLPDNDNEMQATFTF
jgi:amino acid adenylation domain-containing protein/FkbM family methyltransferase